MSDNKIFLDNLVSVIIPVYNSGRYIKQTIESVIKQTYKDIEIILVDDCSNDNSSEIIKEFKSRYGNITYYLHEKNMGVAVTRNDALELSNGQYVAFLDSDDIWKMNKIKQQIDLMKKSNASFSYTAIEMISESGIIIKNKRNVIDKIDYKFLLKNTMMATSSIIIDRKQLGDFRMPLMRSGQDYATWLYLMRNGTIAYGINEALVRYRVCNNSLSSNKLKSIKQVWKIQTEIEGIKKIPAAWHILCFGCNALKKYYF